MMRTMVLIRGVDHCQESLQFLKRRSASSKPKRGCLCWKLAERKDNTQACISLLGRLERAFPRELNVQRKKQGKIPQKQEFQTSMG
jgi:hypothetical protein